MRAKALLTQTFLPLIESFKVFKLPKLLTLKGVKQKFMQLHINIDAIMFFRYEISRGKSIYKHC